MDEFALKALGLTEGEMPPQVITIHCVGETLCVECGMPFTEDNPAGGNEGYLYHQNGCKRNPHHPPQF